MVLTTFRAKKYMYVFNVFFDVNRSGTIDKKDFEIAVEKICKNRGWKEGDEKCARTRKILFQVWDGLRARADQDQDGQVSGEEWCAMWDEYAQNPDKAPEWVNQYMNFIFDLEDASGDGAIDENEFSTVVNEFFPLEKGDANISFKKLSSNGTVEVNRKKFAELWREYFSTEDVNAPGNYIFGLNTFE